MATKYRTILVDPPWDIQQRGGRGANRHYPLMSVGEICALRVSPLASDNAHLWLWTTNAAVPAAHQVIAAWGFRYVNVLTWVKPRLGLGVYLRNASEQLLFAVRGQAPIRFRSQPTWLFAPVQEHSHKPELYALCKRINTYLVRWARKKYRRLHGFKKVNAWWKALGQGYPRLFAH
ncbi:MAG TPA: MT-A70 family methyltransferase, partial [Pseudonocardiaceae bacterium]|nr:MT-A70 family methyltransferase [Pseudonocardiaceae bacterium]